MSEVDVVWLCLDGSAIARGYWDQALIEDALAGELWRPPDPFTFRHHELLGLNSTLPAAEEMADPSGAVVIIPARYHVEHLDRLNAILGRFRWCVLMLTSDEESLFPWQRINHRHLRRWVMTPKPDDASEWLRHWDGVARFIGEGWQPGTRQLVRALPSVRRRRGPFFSGQVTHVERERMAKVLDEMPDAEVYATAGFTQGMPQEEYLGKLNEVMVAPAPSGPATVDSFRLYEALEAGAVPVVSRVTGSGEDQARLWSHLFTATDLLPIVESWDQLPDLTELVSQPPFRAFVSARWQAHKRNMVRTLHEDIRTMRNLVPADRPPDPDPTPDDLITVLIPTSPSPQHPSTAIIEETVESVRARLPHAEVLILADGVRPEQHYLRDAYEEYLDHLVDLCNRRWSNVLPVLSGVWRHQGLMTREAFRMFSTPLTLFVEHDTPLLGDIPFDQLVQPLLTEEVDLIRLHHEAEILEPHRHLMLDSEPLMASGAVPLLRTVQWSQRPHLARTGWYREILVSFFGSKSRTMIEDVMHGVLDHQWNEHGMEGWEKYRVAVYAPPGDIKRSTHLDGRRGPDGELASKFEESFVFAYDSPPPEGAPAPTGTRDED